MKVFESATTDVVGEKAPTLWLEYARFCRERGKFANAQKVYLRAVEVLEPAQVGEVLGFCVRRAGVLGAEDCD